MTPVEVVVSLNELVRSTARTESGDLSTLQGLESICYAFGALLDAYVLANAENPTGMCDDPGIFRAYFAEIFKGGSSPLLGAHGEPEC